MTKKSWFFLVAIILLSLTFVSCSGILTSLIETPVPVIKTGLPPVVLTGEKNMVGMNLWFLNDWDGSRAFVDAMKHSRPWETIEGTPGPLPVDSYGWPLQDARTYFISNMVPELDNGEYTLVFEGQAEVYLQYVAGSVSPVTYDSATNTSTCKITINSQPNYAANLALKKSKLLPTSEENSGFKNVRLYRPSYPADGSKVFTKELVAALTGAGVIRTMDWTLTNCNNIVNWEDRTTPLQSAQGKSGQAFVLGPWNLETNYGVSLEHIVQLCNETNCDLWINVPAVASDSYVTKMAQLLRYGSNGIEPYTVDTPTALYAPLKSNLKVYIEYGNEIWNFGAGFLCFYMIERIVANPPAGLPVLSDDVGPAADNKWANLYQYPAYRLAEVSKLYRSVWGDENMMTRIRPVLCTQQGDANATLSLALVWADKYYRATEGHTPSYYFWGAGGSAYYGVNQVSTFIGALLSENNYPDKSFLKNNAVDSTWAYNYGLKRVAYEGGFGLDMHIGDEMAFTGDEMWKIADDQRTKTLMEKTQEAWAQTGGDLLVYYCLTGANAWGMTKNLDNLNFAKMSAFRNITQSYKAEVTLGKALPGDLTYTELARPETWATLVRTGYAYNTTENGKLVLGGNREGTMLAIPSHSVEAFTGLITVTGLAYADSANLPGQAQLGIWINGQLQGEVTLEQASSGLRTSSALNVAIPKGLVVIRIEVITKGYNFESLKVKKAP